MPERKQKICDTCGVSKWVREFYAHTRRGKRWLRADCKKCARAAQMFRTRQARECQRCHMLKPVESFPLKHGRRLKSCSYCLDQRREADRIRRAEGPPEQTTKTWGFEAVEIWNQHQWGAP